MTSLLSRTGGGDGCTNRPDLDDEGGGEEVGRYIELSRGPFAATRTPTYGTNNRINFTAGTRSLILHGNAPREGSNKRADSFRSSLYRSLPSSQRVYASIDTAILQIRIYLFWKKFSSTEASYRSSH